MSTYDPDEFPPEDPGPDDPPDYEQPPEDRNGQQPIPMGEIDTGEALQGLVAFTRSVNLGTKDNNAHYRIEMPFLVQPGWTWAMIAAQAADAFWHCKAVVYDQAGLPFSVDEGGVLRETLRHQFPDAEPASPQQARPAARAASRGGGGNGARRPTGGGTARFPHPRDMEQPEHISDDIWWDLVDHFDDWYDNRPKKANNEYKDTASDFVRASDRQSVWLRPFVRSGGGGPGRSQGGRGYDD